MRKLTEKEIGEQMLEWLSGKRISSPCGLVFECGLAVRRHLEEISAAAEAHTPHENSHAPFNDPFNAAFTGVPVVCHPDMASDNWQLLYLDGLYLNGYLSDGPTPLEKAFWEARNAQK